MQALVLSHYTVTNALGRGSQATLDALRQRRSGLLPCDFLDADLDTHIGRVDGLEHVAITGALGDYDCRNNRLAQLALEQDGFAAAVHAARERHGPARIAIVVGTSTSGILEAELAYRRRDAAGRLPESFHYAQTQEMSSVAEFCRRYLGLSGPCCAISTACSSSAKAFASAQRLLAAGVCDAAVVGGVDSLCFTTLFGFSSLELVSPRPCRPGDADRDGISIGEGAGFALLERHALAPEAVRLLGYGESSDAYHMSTPHPAGLGAEQAMAAALHRAGLAPADIDYINLHGTASRTNDAAEDQAVSRLFGSGTPCSSTKGWTGHTLGAAGITEAVISALCIEHGFIPGALNTQRVDPEFRSSIRLDNEARPVRTVLSNSFGFGGNNCSLLFGATA